MPRQTQKRPGVEAGMNLIALNSVKAWERIEEHCKEVIDSIPNLSQHEATLEQYRSSSKVEFSKAELDQIVLWKHTVGKNRIYNVKYLNANTEDSIKKHSRAAIAIASAIDLEACLEGDGTLNQNGRAALQESIGELGKLKGVGPATASAILSLVRPDAFCYLYDEVIDCFESQRDYKISNYLRVNSRCLQLARNLGGAWTSSRVAKTIWIAARFLAINGEDPTGGLADHDSDHGKDDEDDDSGGDVDDEGEEDDDFDEEATEETEEKSDNPKSGKKQRTG